MRRTWLVCLGMAATLTAVTAAQAAPGNLQLKPGHLQLTMDKCNRGTVQAALQRAAGTQGHVGSVTLHAGDSQAELRGTQLDQVSRVTVAGVGFLPTELHVSKDANTTRANATEELTITAESTLKMVLGMLLGVDVAFKDGRVAHFDVTVGPPRPEAELVSKTVEGAQDPAIRVANADDLPQGATLVFQVRMIKSTNAGEVKVQVATQDDRAMTELTEKNGGLTVGGRSGLAGRLTPAKAFGVSAFGPLKFRVIEGETAADWVPLATLVRLPHLSSIQCPADPAQQCTLTGSNLFLIESVGAEASYVESINVPAGFTGSRLQVPYPTENGMVLKLRDDPSQVNEVTLRVNTAAAPAAKSHDN